MRTRRLVVAGMAALALSTTAWPARTLTFTESPESLRRGESDGVAMTERGVLFPAPRLIRMSDGRTPGEPNQVWAMTVDGAGNVFLGTGPEGHVIKVDPAGKESLFFSADEPLVTALAVDRGGDLLAGTAPGGKIYRIRPSGQGAVWSETGERYVWALAVTSDGAVFAGTGEHGAVLKISETGAADTFFDSDEAHVVALVPRPEGGLLAGGAGLGLVYSIDREGNGVVLFEDSLPEVAGVASDGAGNVLVAFVAPPLPEGKRPAVQLRLPDGVQVGRTNENVGSLEESTGPLLRGYIEGLPQPGDEAPTRLRGRLVRIAPSGESEELWRSSLEGPFCLLEAGGTVVFGTGEPARLYRVAEDGDVALLATLREAQVTGLLRSRRSVFFATSNPAAAYRIDEGTTGAGVFVSDPFDSGGPSRWGAIRWRQAGAGPGEIELYTRTGNSRLPDGTWSGWGPALTDPDRSRIINPDGRYLQWRVRFVGSRPETARLSAVTFHYEPYNRPPQVRDFRLGGEGRWVSGDATFKWTVRDPDQDRVEFNLQYRPAASGEWRSALLAPRGAGADAVVRQAVVGWREDEFVWDTRDLAEGEYEVRAVASDRAVNDPGEGKDVPVEPSLRLVVDRTPPTHEVRAAGEGRFEVTLSDEHSEVRRLEVVQSGRVVFSVGSTDGVCDSRRETFSVELPAAAPGEYALRGFDAAGNGVDIPLPR